jgi:phosphohistidine phosphatase
MKLYLVRHGDSLQGEQDSKRALSEHGKVEIEHLGRFLANKLKVMEFYHSGKLRAKETAEILASFINPAGIVSIMHGLEPLDNVQSFTIELEVLSNKPNQGDVLIVGHLPFLGKLVAALVTGDEDNSLLDYGCGTLVCLEKAESGHWTIDYILRPTEII